MKKENFIANPLVPEIMREPELFDNCVDGALFSPSSDNRKMVFQVPIDTKDNTVLETQLRTPDRDVLQAEPTPKNSTI